MNCKELTEIKFHSNIKEIGKCCFHNYPKLNIENKIIKENIRNQTMLNDKQIKKIEEYTKSTINRILFDEKVFYENDINYFIDLLKGKDKLLFLMKTIDNNIFWFYIYNSIQLLESLNYELKYVEYCDNNDIYSVFDKKN